MLIVYYCFIFDVILEDVKSSSFSCSGKAKDFHEGEFGKMEYVIEA